jgi:hypothetical protein
MVILGLAEGICQGCPAFSGVIGEDVQGMLAA